MALGSIQTAGNLGLQFAIFNQLDEKKHVFRVLVDSGSSKPVISNKIAEKIGVKFYPATRNSTPGAPPTAKVLPYPISSRRSRHSLSYSCFYSACDYYPCHQCGD